MFARLSGVDGMRISRAAFATMIKFSEFFDDFNTIVDETDLQYDMFKDQADVDV
jgi:myosin heavy subunit